MIKILIISGQFIPFTKSLGGILRVYSFIKLLKKQHEVFLLVSKPIKNKNYGYLGLPRKDISKVNINYISNKSLKITSSMFNYKLLRNIFYLLGFDYAFYLNSKYLEKCYDLIKKNNINYVIVSSPPFSLFYLVKNIKKKFKNIKIILDYRDGWSTRINNIFLFPLKYIVKNFLEKKILNYSDYIIAATLNIKSKVSSLVNYKKKIILIRNGYLSKPKKTQNKNKKIKIGYFGLISDDNSSYRNIRIIFDIIKNNKILQDKFVFEFYGNNDIQSQSIKCFKSFKFKKNISYKNALNKMTEMDFLLIIHTEKSTSKEMVTSKFYDYLSSGSPIINISSGKNEAGEIIKKYKLGKNINYLEDDLSNFLINLKRYKKKLKWNKNLKIFSRDYQNKKLLKMIN